MTVYREAGVVHPTLDAIAADPMTAASLTATKRAALLAQCAVVMAALTAPMVASEDVRGSTPDLSLEVMTTRELADKWGMSEAKIRDLCRNGRLPAKKLGAK